MAIVPVVSKNNSTNLLEQDRFIKCENRASPNQIADAYVDCCKSNSISPPS